MAEAARLSSTEPDPATPERPSLEVIRGKAGASPTRGVDRASTDEPNIGRSAVIGAAIGFAVVTFGITVAGVVGGMHPGSALGLGAFVGTWGGAGFGFMMGGTIPLARHLEDQAARPNQPKQGVSNDPATR